MRATIQYLKVYNTARPEPKKTFNRLSTDQVKRLSIEKPVVVSKVDVAVAIRSPIKNKGWF